MGQLDQLQKKIDGLGHLDKDINSSGSEDYTYAVAGKDEYEWYSNQLYIGGDRKLRLAEYEEMNTYAEIASALDIYADDSTQHDLNRRKVKISSEDKKVQEELEKLFFDRINIDQKIWYIIRTMCLYGDNFGELVLQKDLKGVLYIKLLPPKTMWRVEENGKLKGFLQEVPNSSPVPFVPFHLVHWKLPSTIFRFNPYGTSILEGARRPWRQLKLMEDAMVVYRITRAPERRIFKIDIGRLPTAEAERYVEKLRQKFRKKSFVNKEGEIDWRANTMAPDEDFWIPVREGQEGTQIDTLPGAENLGEIDDVKYFKDKIFSALKIPRIYLQDPDGGTDNARQNLAQQDIRFARTIQRIQTYAIEGLYKVAMVHLMLKGFEKKDLDNFTIELMPPSQLQEEMELEILEKKVSVAESLVQFGFSKENSAFKIFDINKEEWEEAKIQRFREALEEDQVQSGEWQDPDSKEVIDTDANGDEKAIDIQKTSPTDTFGTKSILSFEAANTTATYSRMLSENELMGLKDSIDLSKSKTKKGAAYERARTSIKTQKVSLLNEAEKIFPSKKDSV